MNNQITIGTILKINREGSQEHGCVGPVINIQQIADNKIAYTLSVVLGGLQTPCNVRDGEFELVGSKKDLEDIVFEN